MPLETIAPPAPKPAAAAPAPTPIPEPAPTPIPTPAPAAPKKGADPIAERIKAIAAGKEDPGHAKPEPAAAPVAADPESDDALNQEVEKTTKNWAAGEKAAFTKKTYALRDANRKVKELEGKITAAEAKGADTAALEARLKDAETKQQAAEAKLAAPPPPPTDDVEAIKTKLTAAEKRQADLEQRLAVADVESTDEWANVVTKPKKTIADSIEALAKKHELNPRTLQAALYGTDEEQAAAVEGLSGPEQTKFYSLALRAQEIDGRAETLRTNAAEALVKINEKRIAETGDRKAGEKKAFTEAHTENWKSLVEALPVLAPVDGTDEISVAWNKSLDTAKKASGETDFDALAPADKAKVLVRSQVFPNLVGALQAREATIESQTKTIAEQAETIAKFESNRPGAEVTPKDGDPPAKPAALGAKGTAARIMAAVGGIR